MKILIELKNGERLEKECKQAFVNIFENVLHVIYGVFEGELFNINEIRFFNIENN